MILAQELGKKKKVLIKMSPKIKQALQFCNFCLKVAARVIERKLGGKQMYSFFLDIFTIMSALKFLFVNTILEFRKSINQTFVIYMHYKK